MSRPYHAKSFWDLIQLFSKKSFYHQGFFAVKRRAVFILGAMRCSKAVFHVFVFDSIHDSATMQNIHRTIPLSQ